MALELILENLNLNWKMGRRPQTEAVQKKVRQMHFEGISQTKISKELKMSRSSVELILFPDQVRTRVRESRKQKKSPVRRFNEFGEELFYESARLNWAI